MRRSSRSSCCPGIMGSGALLPPPLLRRRRHTAPPLLLALLPFFLLLCCIHPAASQRAIPPSCTVQPLYACSMRVEDLPQFGGNPTPEMLAGGVGLNLGLSGSLAPTAHAGAHGDGSGQQRRDEPGGVKPRRPPRPQRAPAAVAPPRTAGGSQPPQQQVPPQQQQTRPGGSSAAGHAGVRATSAPGSVPGNVAGSGAVAARPGAAAGGAAAGGGAAAVNRRRRMPAGQLQGGVAGGAAAGMQAAARQQQVQPAAAQQSRQQPNSHTRQARPQQQQQFAAQAGGRQGRQVLQAQPSAEAAATATAAAAQDEEVYLQATDLFEPLGLLDRQFCSIKGGRASHRPAYAAAASSKSTARGGRAAIASLAGGTHVDAMLVNNASLASLAAAAAAMDALAPSTTSTAAGVSASAKPRGKHQQRHGGDHKHRGGSSHQPPPGYQQQHGYDEASWRPPPYGHEEDGEDWRPPPYGHEEEEHEDDWRHYHRDDHEQQQQQQQQTLSGFQPSWGDEGLLMAEAGNVPADSTLAVGPFHVLHVVNSLVKILPLRPDDGAPAAPSGARTAARDAVAANAQRVMYADDDAGGGGGGGGGPSAAGSDGATVVTLPDFFGLVASPCDGGYITPSAAFDKQVGRFLLAAVCGGDANQILLAVSQTSDATGSWWLYSLPGYATYDTAMECVDEDSRGPGGGPARANPYSVHSTVGYNRDGVFVSFVQNCPLAGAPGATGAVLLALPKWALYSGATSSVVGPVYTAYDVLRAVGQANDVDFEAASFRQLQPVLPQRPEDVESDVAYFVNDPLTPSGLPGRTQLAVVALINTGSLWQYTCDDDPAPLLVARVVGRGADCAISPHTWLQQPPTDPTAPVGNQPGMCAPLDAGAAHPPGFWSGGAALFNSQLYVADRGPDIAVGSPGGGGGGGLHVNTNMFPSIYWAVLSPSLCATGTCAPFLGDDWAWDEGWDWSSCAWSDGGGGSWEAREWNRERFFNVRAAKAAGNSSSTTTSTAAGGAAPPAGTTATALLRAGAPALQQQGRRLQQASAAGADGLAVLPPGAQAKQPKPFNVAFKRVAVTPSTRVQRARLAGGRAVQAPGGSSNEAPLGELELPPAAADAFAGGNDSPAVDGGITDPAAGDLPAARGSNDAAGSAPDEQLGGADDMFSFGSSARSRPPPVAGPGGLPGRTDPDPSGGLGDGDGSSGGDAWQGLGGSGSGAVPPYEPYTPYPQPYPYPGGEGYYGGGYAPPAESEYPPQDGYYMPPPSDGYYPGGGGYPTPPPDDGYGGGGYGDGYGYGGYPHPSPPPESPSPSPEPPSPSPSPGPSPSPSPSPAPSPSPSPSPAPSPSPSPSPEPSPSPSPEPSPSPSPEPSPSPSPEPSPSPSPEPPPSPSPQPSPSPSPEPSPSPSPELSPSPSPEPPPSPSPEPPPSPSPEPPPSPSPEPPPSPSPEPPPSPSPEPPPSPSPSPDPSPSPSPSPQPPPSPSPSPMPWPAPPPPRPPRPYRPPAPPMPHHHAQHQDHDDLPYEQHGGGGYEHEKPGKGGLKHHSKAKLQAEHKKGGGLMQAFAKPTVWEVMMRACGRRADGPGPHSHAQYYEAWRDYPGVRHVYSKLHLPPKYNPCKYYRDWHADNALTFGVLVARRGVVEAASQQGGTHPVGLAFPAVAVRDASMLLVYSYAGPGQVPGVEVLPAYPGVAYSVIPPGQLGGSAVFNLAQPGAGCINQGPVPGREQQAWGSYSGADVHLGSGTAWSAVEFAATKSTWTSIPSNAGTWLQAFSPARVADSGSRLGQQPPGQQRTGDAGAGWGQDLQQQPGQRRGSGGMQQQEPPLDDFEDDQAMFEQQQQLDSLDSFEEGDAGVPSVADAAPQQPWWAPRPANGGSLPGTAGGSGSAAARAAPVQQWQAGGSIQGYAGQQQRQQPLMGAAATGAQLPSAAVGAFPDAATAGPAQAPAHQQQQVASWSQLASALQTALRPAAAATPAPQPQHLTQPVTQEAADAQSAASYYDDYPH